MAFDTLFNFSSILFVNWRPFTLADACCEIETILLQRGELIKAPEPSSAVATISADVPVKFVNDFLIVKPSSEMVSGSSVVLFIVKCGFMYFLSKVASTVISSPGAICPVIIFPSLSVIVINLHLRSWRFCNGQETKSFGSVAVFN